MSHYGPHGEAGRGPDAGRGPEAGRWGEEPGRWGPEEYGPPSDPWGAAPVADSWNDYGSTAPPHSPYDDPYSGRGTPPPRRNVGLYALVAVLVVLAAGAVGYALYLLSGDEPEETTGGGATPSPTTSATASSEPDASASPRDNIGLNATQAQVDDCLVNDGTDNQPQMRIVACDSDEGSQVFRILAKFDERVEGEGAAANEQAQEVCSGTEGYKFHYYEVSETASFVLCMTDA
jgi:hypothetical protein